MAYIPKEHEKYNLLPFSQKNGGEVFEYPSELIKEAEELIGTTTALIPYNYESYEEYFAYVDLLIKENADCTKTVAILRGLCDTIRDMNQKEEWSILKYIGPTDDACFGLTHGKNYYWPTRKSNPVYCGVIDDEEFTAYLYATDADMWEILEDPTGMAYRTIYKKDNGYMSKEEHKKIMFQLKSVFKQEEQNETITSET